MPERLPSRVSRSMTKLSPEAPARADADPAKPEGAPASTDPRRDHFAQARGQSVTGTAESAVARTTDPKRRAAFVADFEAQLHLDPAQLRARQANGAKSAMEFFAANPGLFFRDAATLGTFSLLERAAPIVDLAGDCHINNFGTARREKGGVTWGLNDFDQAGRGSPEIDLARLATSVALAARKMGATPQQEEALLRAVGSAYADAVGSIATRGAPKSSSLQRSEVAPPLTELVDKAARADRGDFLKKWTKGLSKGEPKFDHEELRKVPDATKRALADALAGSPTPVKIIDVAEKIGSGGSSFGLKRYYVLVEAQKRGGKPIVLEVKQCLPELMRDQRPDLSRADAALVEKRAKALGVALNPLTSSVRIGSSSFLVRELEPEKARVDAGKDLDGLPQLEALAEQAVRVLASAHSHAKGAGALKAWVGADAARLSTRLAEVASGLASQTEADLQSYRELIGG